MNFFYFITILILCGLNVRAQTNLAATTNSAPRVTRIESDGANFDLNKREAVYRGNVRVSDPQMKLRCAWLTADWPQSGGRMNRIIARTNVLIDFTDAKGQTMHAAGEQAIYVFQIANDVTNETVTLTGNPQVENAQGWLTGDSIVWDRANNQLHATNQKMIYRQNLNGAVKTNSPPGAIDNIDKVLPATQNAP